MKIKFILVFIVLALATAVIWRITSCELANMGLQEDLRDLAAQAGTRIGLTAASTDDDLRNAVMRKTEEHAIQIEPEQVTVQRSGSAEAPIIYLAVDYDVRINLYVYSLTLHFNPSSKSKSS